MMDRGPLETKLRPVVPLWDPVAYELAKGRLQTRISLVSRRRRRRRGVGIAAGTAAAILVALLVTQLALPPGGGGPASGDATELHRLSILAGRLPELRAGKGYIYVRSKLSGLHEFEDISTGVSFAIRVLSVRDSWLGADGSGLTRTRYRSVSFPTAADRAGWLAMGRPDIPGEGTVDTARYGQGKLTPFPSASLPSDPDALRRAIAKDPTLRTLSLTPRSVLSTIGYLLATQTLAADVRRALLVVASRLPGISVRKRASDPTGRLASVVTATYPGGESSLFFDPTDASLLAESRSLSDGSDRGYWTAYVRAGIVRVAGRIPRSN